MGPTPLVGRDTQLRLLRSAIDSGSSVVVLGAAGTGKSRLLQEALATTSLPATLVVGTEAAAQVPLGAFAPALPDALPGDPFDRLQAAVRWLSPRGPLLAVDDAHLLDALSTTLLQQVIAAGTFPVVATARSDVPLAPAVATRWGDGAAELLPLEDLDRNATDALVLSILDGPVTPRTAHTLWARTQGNPLAVSELLRVALDRGAIRRVGGIWRLDAEVALPRATSALIASRIAALPAPERDAFELIALGEPLPLAAIDALGIQAPTEALEERGLLTVLARPGGAWIRPHHPLHGDAVRAGTPPVRSARHLRALAGVAYLVAPHDPIRAARWQLTAGGDADPDLLRRAAIAARGIDPDLVWELAAAAVARATTAPNLVVLAQAAAARGEVDRALSAVRRAAGVAVDDAELAELAVTVLRWLAPQATVRDEALACVRELVARLHEADAVALVETELASGAAVLGHREQVLRSVGQSLERPRVAPRTAVAAETARLVFELFAGRTDGVEQEISRIGVLGAEVDDVFHRALLSAGRSTWCCLVGRIDEAVTQDRRLLGAAIEDGAPTGQVLASMWLSVALELAGSLRDSLGVLLDVEPLLVHAEPYSLRHFHPAVVATVQCQLGDHQAARTALDGLPEEAMDDLRVRAWASRARVWLRAHEGSLDDAARTAAALGDELVSQGWLVYAAFQHFDAVRLGRPDQAAMPLRSIADAADDSARLLQLMAEHAGAALDADGLALDEVAAGWASAGAMLLAAEAAGSASVQHARDGRPDRAARSAARADTWATRSPGARTPALLGWSSPLTSREHEVARHAIRGASSREIAAALFISTRTVDNHLAATYRKLGIDGRQELATALGVPGPSDGASAACVHRRPGAGTLGDGGRRAIHDR